MSSFTSDGNKCLDFKPLSVSSLTSVPEYQLQVFNKTLVQYRTNTLVENSTVLYRKWHVSTTRESIYKYKYPEPNHKMDIAIPEYSAYRKVHRGVLVLVFRDFSHL
ncbi:hypothetical protein L873DRAFT_1785811 [Choiromyces venosus 120613-1]|uniref:Uncharacterized protein n=1 Tax=Choiromyces venosus 120613-1 TaxID=1336337 RepID=A0A3N4K3L2_9PEZI|nr:hypothetical protein L873DRAFT_1785811 [Choiromyces venosus 120613-1]